MNEMTQVSSDDIHAPQPEMIRVWDPLVRLFHWGLAAGFTIAFLTEDDLLALHVWAGYTVLGLLVFRLFWGFVGPRHARWTDFVKTPGEIIAYLQDAVRFRAARHLGHNPAGGAMVVALMVCLTATGLSGLAVHGGQELSGPLAPLLGGLSEGWAHTLEDVHEVLANLTLVLVFLHLAGVAFARFQHQENLPLAMLTGTKRSTTK